MDLIIIIAIGAIVAATGIISPGPKDSDISEEVKVVKTEEVTPPAPEPTPEPTPTPTPEPAPAPAAAAAAAAAVGGGAATAAAVAFFYSSH